MKKGCLISLLLFMFLYSPLSSQNYITVGANIDLGFNCDKAVIDEIGLIIPKPSLYLGFNIFKENKKLGVYFDGNIIFSHSKETLCLGFGSLLAPSFLLLLTKNNGFIISPGLSFGFLLGGTSNKEKETTIGQAYIGIGSNITYFFKSGFSIGLNLNYYPLMLIHHSIKEDDISKRLEKNENSFSIGITIGYTDWF